jgi:hypothetical protein
MKSGKPRYDLWILRDDTIRLVAAKKKAKKCHKTANEVELNRGEIFLMTPVSSEAYCPLLVRTSS